MLLSITALLRAHLSLIIDNREFQDILIDPSSKEFNDISKPLCNEVRTYFLLRFRTFYLISFIYFQNHVLCKLTKLRHYTLECSRKQLTPKS